MYTKRRFPFRTVLVWTKREIIFFFIISTVATVLFELVDLKWLQIPLTPIGLIGTAVAFMIGFQNNAAYDRIWEARKIWGGIVNASRTLIITAKDSLYIHNPAGAQPEPEVLKAITNRHIAWLNALRYAMRTKKEWEASYSQDSDKRTVYYHTLEHEIPLEDELKPFLSEKEFAYVMSKENKPNALISLQSKHLKELADKGVYWDFTLLRMQEILQELTSLQGKSERIKNFPYPKQYGSLSFHFVHIFIWLMPLAIIPAFARMGANISITNPLIGEHFVWLNIPVTVIVIWVFNTMLRIGMSGENPFEGSPNDVPITNISRGISRDILQIIDTADSEMLPPIENENSVHM